MDIEKAKQTFLDIKRILDNNNVKFWLVDGTALGAVRNHGFILGDEDIDLRVLTADWNSELLCKEFLSHGFGCRPIKDPKQYKDMLVGFVISKRGIKTDICLGYYYPPDDEIVVLAHHPLSNVTVLPARFFRGAYFIEFLGVEVCVPNAPEEYLEIRYGKDWQIPRAGSYPHSVPISIMNQVKYFRANPEINQRRNNA